MIIGEIRRYLRDNNSIRVSRSIKDTAYRAMQVKEKMPDAVFIFIAPPSYKALSDRLHRRGTESEEVIKERLDKAEREIGIAPHYDYIVINDDVDNAADRIMAIIRAEHAKCSRSLEGYYELMKGSK